MKYNESRVFREEGSERMEERKKMEQKKLKNLMDTIRRTLQHAVMLAMEIKRRSNG